MLTIPIVNNGPHPAYVHAIQLDAPHYAPVPPDTVDAAMEPGQQISFSIGYGAAQCGAISGDVTLLLQVGRPGPTSKRERLEAPGPVEVLDRLRKVDCDQSRLESSFRVTWGPTWTQVPSGAGAARLHGDLLFTLLSTDRVAVTDVRGSVMFNLDERPVAKPPIVQLDPQRRSATLPVEISVRLCFKHGLIEAKRIFDFGLHVTINGGGQLYRTITPPRTVQAESMALFKTCPPTG